MIIDSGREELKDKKFDKNISDEKHTNKLFLRLVAKGIKFTNINFKYWCWSLPTCKNGIYGHIKFWHTSLQAKMFDVKAFTAQCSKINDAKNHTSTPLTLRHPEIHAVGFTLNTEDTAYDTLLRNRPHGINSVVSRIDLKHLIFFLRNAINRIPHNGCCHCGGSSSEASPREFRDAVKGSTIT